MASEAPAGWRSTSLGDVLELKRGYDLPTRLRIAGPVPIISSSGPSGWHDESKVEGPGVVTGRYGTVGEVYYVAGAFWPLNTALYVRDFKGSNPKFVFYFLKTIQWSKFTDKAAVPGVNRNHVHLEPVEVPPLDEQRRIAAVLGALDDKIELNRKMSRTLEEMAQAIFKSWFIDFDGVPASELVESELGPIPRGWRAGKLGAVAKQHRLTVNPEEQQPDTPYISLADMPQGSIALAEWGHASDATSAKAAFAEDDILFGKLRPYFKKVGVAPCDGVCSSDIIVARPKERPWYGYVLGLLTLDAFIDFTTAVSTGTRMPRVSWNAMASYDIAVPPRELAARFDGFVRPVVQRIKANIWQARTLAAVRDALLPKLISGEIRVPEAEDAVEAAL